MKACLVCGEVTKRNWLATLYHFRLYERGQWKYLSGNCSVFGKLGGFHSVLCLAFPFYNTIRYWRHRKSELVLPGGLSLASAFDANGCALRGTDQPPGAL